MFLLLVLCLFRLILVAVFVEPEDRDCIYFLFCIKLVPLSLPDLMGKIPVLYFDTGTGCELNPRARLHIILGNLTV